MDSAIGIQGKDFVMLATDAHVNYSIFRLKVSPLTLRATMIKSKSLTPTSSSLFLANLPIARTSESILKRT